MSSQFSIIAVIFFNKIMRPSDTKAWISQEQVKMLPNWPAQSPDLSPIENLWDELQRQLRKRNP